LDHEDVTNHGREVVLNSAAMTEDNKVEARKLLMRIAMERVHLYIECIEDQVEQKATWCQDTQCKFISNTIKYISICTKPKRWWIGDIKEKKKPLEREKLMGLISGGAAHAEPEFHNSI
jgi:hypothetical protein